MKAARIHAYGHSDQIEVEDVTSPTNKADEVLVRIHAAGINPVDWKIREGYMAQVAPRPFPFTLGQDFAGEIVSVGGSVTGFEVGDRVYGFTNGAYAEIAVASPSMIARSPATIDDATAATLPTPGLTALQCVRIAGVQQFQYVLIHGAAGGVGSIATQLCVASGAHVIATASAKDLQYLRGLGVTRVIDYNVEPFENETRNIDAVIDTVGGDTTRRSFIVTKRGGVVVSTVGPIDKGLAKEAGVVAVRMLMQRNADDLRELAGLIDGGLVKPRSAQVMPLLAAREAQELYESGGASKIVLDVG